MGLSDNAMTLSEAAETYGPDGDTKVVVLRWDNWADPLTSDLVSPIAGYEDTDDVELRRPNTGTERYYVDRSGDVYDIDAMLAGEPDWFDPPAEPPDWYANQTE